MKTNPLKVSWAVLNHKERLQFVGLIIAFSMSAVIETLALSILFPFVSLLSDPGVLHTSKFFETTYRISGAQSKKEFLIMSALTIFAVYIFKSLFSVAIVFFQSKFVFGSQRRVANRLFQLYMEMPYSFHLQRTTTDLMKIVVTDLGSFFEVVLMPITIMFSEVITVLGVIILLILVDPLSAICSALLLTSCMYAYFRFFRRELTLLGSEQQKKGFELYRWASRGFGGIKEIKIAKGEAELQQGFDAAGNRYTRSLRKLRTINELPRLLLELVAVGGMLLVCFLVFVQGNSTELVVPIIGLFAAATFKLIPSFAKIITSLNLIAYHRPLAELVETEFLAARPQDNISSSHQTKDFKWKSSLELKNVSFQYAGRVKPVLSNINLTIQRGDWTAIVGPSGVGKSTLVDLLLGLISPTSGEIIVDGRRLDQVTAAWTKLIGYVPQDIFMHDGSLRQNVAFGMPPHTVDDELVRAVIEKAGLRDFIQSLPKGLDTTIGDYGSQISGGQRQRLGIARALYRNPEILILDEATASLDSESEKSIFNDTKNIFEGKTVILVSHQPLPIAFMKRRLHLEAALDGNQITTIHET